MIKEVRVETGIRSVFVGLSTLCNERLKLVYLSPKDDDFRAAQNQSGCAAVRRDDICIHVAPERQEATCRERSGSMCWRRSAKRNSLEPGFYGGRDGDQPSSRGHKSVSAAAPRLSMITTTPIPSPLGVPRAPVPSSRGPTCIPPTRGHHRTLRGWANYFAVGTVTKA
jgi:hypothetical protein